MLFFCQLRISHNQLGQMFLMLHTDTGSLQQLNNAQWTKHCLVSIYSTHAHNVSALTPSLPLTLPSKARMENHLTETAMMQEHTGNSSTTLFITAGFMTTTDDYIVTKLINAYCHDVCSATLCQSAKLLPHYLRTLLRIDSLLGSMRVRGPSESKYGCFIASRAGIRFLDSNCSSFPSRSIASLSKRGAWMDKGSALY